MRTLTLSLILITFFSISEAQSLRGLDKSPLDIAYLPHNYAHDREPSDKVIAKVVYSRPQKKNRVVFGGMVPYDEVWRTGANENTEIHFYQDVTIGDGKIEAGTYSLFSIPGEKTWTIILNSDIDYWGAYSYNKENDVLRSQVNSKQVENVIEAFTIQFETIDDGNSLMKLAWDTTVIELPIKY